MGSTKAYSQNDFDKPVLSSFTASSENVDILSGGCNSYYYS